MCDHGRLDVGSSPFDAHATLRWKTRHASGTWWPFSRMKMYYASQLETLRSKAAAKRDVLHECRSEEV